MTENGSRMLAQDDASLDIVGFLKYIYFWCCLIYPTKFQLFLIPFTIKYPIRYHASHHLIHGIHLMVIQWLDG